MVCQKVLQINKNQEIKDMIREHSKDIQRVRKYICAGKFKPVSNHRDTRFVGVDGKQLRHCIMPSDGEGRHRTVTPVGRGGYIHTTF